MTTSAYQEDKMMNTLRRMDMVNRVFWSKMNSTCRPSNHIVLNGTCSMFCRHETTATAKGNPLFENGKLKIGEVEKFIKVPLHPEYVPVQYLSKDLSENILSNLKWMLQKDQLGQDVFLIGRPGRYRRWIAMMYSQLTQREIEFVSLSRDTTEADLKQRREIIDGSAIYVDQSAVRAAIQGRILILEGVEKAERNVLPLMNNLLENREMHLEDGRFLIAANNYDKLLQVHGQEYMNKHNLVRVHDDFRVIALGIPVPSYVGNPLDPPLRSRFQARDINPPQYWEVKSYLLSAYPSTDVGKLEKLLSCAYALMSDESKAVGIPDFPVDHLFLAAKILSLDSTTEISDLFTLLFPYTIMLPMEGCRAVSNILNSFRVRPMDAHTPSLYSKLVDKKPIDTKKSVLYTDKNVSLEVKIGGSKGYEKCEYIPIHYHDHVLMNLLRLQAADSDICIVGPSSSGKSVLVKKFSEILNYDVEPIILYQDMTARDLIQQRETLPYGDTFWRNSPLVNAALQGKLALLDGLHRVHTSTLSILHRLICDRELQLHDGQRLLRHDKYDYLSSKYGTEYLLSAGVHRIHPAFRIIALAQPSGGYNSHWLTSEILTLFPVYSVRALSQQEEKVLIEATIGNLDIRMSNVLNIVQRLRTSADPALVSVSSSFTTRQLLRMAKRFSNFLTYDDVYEAIQRACLAKFLSLLTRKALDTMLLDCGIKPSPSLEYVAVDSPKKICSVNANTITIGNTTVARYQTECSVKVPNVLFYDSPQHTDLLEQLLQDFAIGEHLLLVGNQGVGKNKLTDRLLQMLNRPREYIQLHRDSTIQSLTVQPSIVSGQVKYEDSPLLKAVQQGHVLVVDEADKAPTHVTCILKSLIESGEMILSDGRRIVRREKDANLEDPNSTSSKLIRVHPDFRMILLANRPGFPFLGNNLFAVLGDLFSVHVIDNPSPESEIKLLKRYAPNVDASLIKRIVSAFGDLRELADKGLVAYPYSTREAVNVVKHLQAYPSDDLGQAVSNIFDFDRYSSEMKDILQQVMNKYDIPVDLTEVGKVKGENLQLTIERHSGLEVLGPKHGKVDETRKPHVGGNTWAGGTGGRDTAGLGGKGGPYRLDAGHAVHQLSDEEKNAVPEHVKKAAREMGLKAFKERLKEIQMSEYDSKLYYEFSSGVQNQVRSLRVIINNLQAKSKERQWSKHQMSGEFDDTKLVESITGERNVYRRRTDLEPELGSPQIKPKRLKLVVDVSGSMYRFNGYDSRLDREMEAVVMVMEALQGYENKIHYDIVGHSGESDCIVFVSKKNPPADNKHRLEIIKTMHAHAQFCMSGDHTLEATKKAIKALEKEREEFDEGIVVILSDANLSRYGIEPRKLAEALQSSNVVSAYAIFIGSMGDQAVRLTNAMPAGRAFVSMNLENIPQIIGQIFTSSLLRST